MATFYDEWLRYWEEEKEEKARSRKFIHEEELEWVRTQQDYRVALLCSRENGFATVGNLMRGENSSEESKGKGEIWPSSKDRSRYSQAIR